MSAIIRSASVSSTSRVLRRQEEPVEDIKKPLTAQAKPVPQASAPATAQIDQQYLSRLVEAQLAEEKEKAARELARLKEEAVKKGYEEGKASAEAELKNSLSKMQKEMHHQADALKSIQAALYEQAENDLIAMVYTACSKIIGSLAVEPAVLSEMIRQYLRSTNSLTSVDIHLHPDDIDGVLAHLSQSERESFTWKADANVSLGGCIVESADGTLDARLETQFARLKQVLLDARVQRGLHGEST